jgi:hypothetical protein
MRARRGHYGAPKRTKIDGERSFRAVLDNCRAEIFAHHGANLDSLARSHGVPLPRATQMYAEARMRRGLV